MPEENLTEILFGAAVGAYKESGVTLEGALADMKPDMTGDPAVDAHIASMFIKTWEK